MVMNRVIWNELPLEESLIYTLQCKPSISQEGAKTGLLVFTVKAYMKEKP